MEVSQNSIDVKVVGCGARSLLIGLLFMMEIFFLRDYEDCDETSCLAEISPLSLFLPCQLQPLALQPADI
jgi:hypothetical protein